MKNIKIPNPKKINKSWIWTKKDDDALTYLYLNCFKDGESIRQIMGQKIKSCVVNSRLSYLDLRKRKFECITPEMDSIIRRECRIMGRTREVALMLGMTQRRLAEYVKHINLYQISVTKEVRIILNDKTITEEKRQQLLDEYQKKHKVANDSNSSNEKEFLFEIEILMSNGEWEWYGCVAVADRTNKDSTNINTYNFGFNDMVRRAEHKARNDFWQLHYKTWRLFPNTMFLNAEQKKSTIITKVFKPIEPISDKELQKIVRQKREDRERVGKQALKTATEHMKQFLSSMTDEEKILWKKAVRLRRELGKNKDIVCKVSTKELFQQLKKANENKSIPV